MATSHRRIHLTFLCSETRTFSRMGQRGYKGSVRLLYFDTRTFGELDINAGQSLVEFETSSEQVVDGFTPGELYRVTIEPARGE